MCEALNYKTLKKKNHSWNKLFLDQTQNLKVRRSFWTSFSVSEIIWNCIVLKTKKLSEDWRNKKAYLNKSQSFDWILIGLDTKCLRPRYLECSCKHEMIPFYSNIWHWIYISTPSPVYSYKAGYSSSSLKPLSPGFFWLLKNATSKWIVLVLYCYHKITKKKRHYL